MDINPIPKNKPLRDKKYLAWLRRQRPLIFGQGKTEAHHVRILGNGGTGIKPPDNDCIPIPESIHREIHNRGEITILCETFGYSVNRLRFLCDNYYLIYLMEKDKK